MPNADTTVSLCSRKGSLLTDVQLAVYQDTWSLGNQLNCEQPNHGVEGLLIQVFSLILNGFLEEAIYTHTLYKIIFCMLTPVSHQSLQGNDRKL